MVPGIDVSHYDGSIDWTQVAASGVRFAYIKCTEGAAFLDPEFVENWSGATESNILAGAYHFLTDADPVLQASLFRRHCPVYGLPPALDIEISSITPELVNRFLAALPGEMRMRVMPYLDAFYIDDFSELITRKVWIAHYRVLGPSPGPWPTWTFWQHSNQGSVPGIAGAVDLDWFNGTQEELEALLAKPT